MPWSTGVVKDPKGLIGGTNMVAIKLAEAVGGNLFLGFISAVAFATILAVVSGLTLAGASAISHDLYASVIAKGRVNETTELRVLQGCDLRPRHGGHRPGYRLREPERRLHGRPGLRHRGERQLPGAGGLHLLEQDDHPRCHDRRLRRSDHRRGA